MVATCFDDDSVLILLTCDDFQTLKTCTVLHRVGVAGRDRIEAVTSRTRERTKNEAVRFKLQWNNWHNLHTN